MFLSVSFADIFEKSDLKTFFESNCSQIYFIFYENFITLESNLKQKGKEGACVSVLKKGLWLLPQYLPQ